MLLKRKYKQQQQLHSLNDLKLLLKTNKAKCLFLLGLACCTQVNNIKDLDKLILKIGNLPIKKVVNATTAYLVSI